MRKYFKNLPVSLALAVVIGTGGFASADVLRIGSTGSVTEILKHLGAAFTAVSEISVEVIPSLGSSGAIHAVADGVIDIAVSGRTLRPDELAKGLTQVLSLRTPYGLVTSRRNPNGMRITDVATVFNAANSRWADGKPIRIILRPRSDSDTMFMEENFPGMSAAIEAARSRPDTLVAATDQLNADLAESVEGSLSGATLTQIKMEKRMLRFVALDGIEPTLKNIEQGIYPFAKPLFVIVSAKKNQAVERFIAFLRSPRGVETLREADILSAAKP